MEHFNISIARRYSQSGSIIGELSVNGGERLCYTLELPWRWNAANVSCVPNGIYNGMVRYDHDDRWRIELVGVPGRKNVQIHIGNYPKDTLGCVLVGMVYEANRVKDSKSAYKLLRTAFYGSDSPVQTPFQTIQVELKGAQATPWGDYQTGRRGSSLA